MGDLSDSFENPLPRKEVVRKKLVYSLYRANII